MTEGRKSDTRTRLLEAAAELIADAPGQDVALRAICDRAGVRLPTLYHFFGSKDGLLDAVIEHGFDRYLSLKAEQESSGDPIQDLRAGWDAHVDFGLANPGFYALMYGQVVPGRRPAAQDRASDLLRSLVAEADRHGRIAVPVDQAAAHVLAANIGVTLRQIVLAEPDPELSDAMRDAAIAAITGRDRSASGVSAAAHALLAALSESHADDLGREEIALLRAWLVRLGRSAPASGDGN